MVKKGRFGDVSLDGLNVAAMLGWPAPIHQGHGERLLIIDDRADDA